MAGIKDLKLGKDVAINDGDWANVPEQIGSRKAPLYPGPYRFVFPVLAAIAECFDAFETTVNGAKVSRVVAVLRDGAELTVTQAPQKYADRVGEAWGTRISNAERRRGKGEDAPTASDMDYVIGLFAADKPRPKTNRQYLEAFQAAVPEQEFGADVEWNWRCDDKRAVRVPDPDADGRTIALDGTEGREDRKGCGAKFYQKDVDKVDKDGKANTAGEYPRTVDCTCGAVLFANENLQNFRK